MVTLGALVKQRERQLAALAEAEIVLICAALAIAPGDAESLHRRLASRGCTLEQSAIGQILRAERRAGRLHRDGSGIYSLKVSEERRSRARRSAA